MTGVGTLTALCRSLNNPVPIFIGIPMMMHSDTPETGTQATLALQKVTKSQRYCPEREDAQVYRKRSLFVQSRRHRKGGRLFSQKKPA